MPVKVDKRKNATKAQLLQLKEAKCKETFRLMDHLDLENRQLGLQGVVTLRENGGTPLLGAERLRFVEPAAPPTNESAPARPAPSKPTTKSLLSNTSNITKRSNGDRSGRRPAKKRRKN